MGHSGRNTLHVRYSDVYAAAVCGALRSLHGVTAGEGAGLVSHGVRCESPRAQRHGTGATHIGR